MSVWHTEKGAAGMNDHILEDLKAARETCWINEEMHHFSEEKERLLRKKEDIEDASVRLERFAPLIEKLFPETAKDHGLIESPLREIASARAELEKKCGELPEGRLFLKCDSHLAIAGSVKARGGIYEVLKHTEELAFEQGILKEGDSCEKLLKHRDFFAGYKMQVGSTGNLGMSIGIMSAALGYQAIVHMSADAKEWKKKLLRSKGVTVKEYADDYGRAVIEGRKLSEADPKSYFVDDEHSKDLFLGYAVAGERLRKQVEEQQITVNETHPLFVYLPCGVGGAPGGITFGLKQIWGDNVHCFFVEPVQAPCMAAALVTEKGSSICVQDLGLSGKTEADGLAVGRASQLVYEMMRYILDGEFTVEDEKLPVYMRLLWDAEQICIEPSSCAAFDGYTAMLHSSESIARYNEIMKNAKGATHILWATGGSLMPEEVRQELLERVR